MKLYQDNLIRLYYYDLREVMCVETQNSEELRQAEVRRVFASVIAYARERLALRVLLDFTWNVVELNESDCKAAMALLAVGLKPTGIRKLAEVASAPTRECGLETTYSKIRTIMGLDMEFRSFTSRKEALCWLMA